MNQVNFNNFIPRKTQNKLNHEKQKINGKKE